MSRRRATNPRVRRTATGALLLGASLMMVTGQTSAQVGQSSFTATANARMVSVDFVLEPTIGFDPLFDGGQGVAQAQIDSLGTSSAFASSTYPGATVTSLGGLLGTLTEGDLGSEDIPAYPFLVQSSYPTTPSDRRDAGTMVLQAQSSPTLSGSSATDGAFAATASTTVDAATGDVVSKAETTIGSFQVGDVVEVHGIRSVAEVRQSPSGELQRSSSFEIAAVTIMGERVSITSEGVSPDGPDIPLGALLDDVTGAALQPVLESLAEEGTSIETFPAAHLDDGISSAGLRITAPFTPPPSVASGVDKGIAVITLGGNVVSVANTAIPSFNSPVAVPVPDVAFDSGVPVDVPASGPPIGVDPVIIDPGSASDPDSTGPVDSGDHASQALPVRVSSIDVEVSATGFYAVLAAAAAVLFAIARLFVYLGGKTS